MMLQQCTICDTIHRCANRNWGEFVLRTRTVVEHRATREGLPGLGTNGPWRRTCATRACSAQKPNTRDMAYVLEHKETYPCKAYRFQQEIRECVNIRLV